MKPTSALVAALVIVGSVTAGCSVPTDETATAIDPDSLPEQLRQTTTTPPTTPAATATTEEMIFFLEERTEDERTVVSGANRDIEDGAELFDVLEQLFVGPTEGEFEDGSVSALSEFELLGVTKEERDDGTSIAVVNIGVIDPLTGEEQTIPSSVLRDSAAQLTWTTSGLTMFSISGVRILVEGQAVVVPIDGGDTPVGAVVNVDQYQNYDPDASATPRASTTTAASGATGSNSTTPARPIDPQG